MLMISLRKSFWREELDKNILKATPCNIIRTMLIISCPLLHADINECKHANICVANSHCKNTEGSYQCICKTGLVMSDTGKCFGEYVP